MGAPSPEPAASATEGGGARRLVLPALTGAVLAAGLVLRLWNATRDVDRLIQTTLPDDAFYYFGIARHLALGHPPSIDGISPTNGYHPLWMALLVPVYWLEGAGDLIGPIQIALALSAVVDAMSAWLLYRITRALELSPIAGLVALVPFCLSPFQIVNATCGLETSVALCLALTTLFLHLTSPVATRPRALLLGVTGGLAVLGRTDQALVVAAILGVRAYQTLRGAGPRTALRNAVVSGGAALVVFAPWALFSYSTVGTVVQSSGVALAYVHRRMPEVWGLGAGDGWLAAERTWASVVEATLVICRWHALAPAAAATLAAVCVGSFLVQPRAQGGVLVRQLVRLGPWLLSITALFFAHTVGRTVFREWYTAPFIVTTALLAAVTVDHLLRVIRRRTFVVVGAGTAVLAWLLSSLPEHGQARYRQQRAGAPSAGLHEGHSDCGVVAYFSERGITNLDGIVNQAALEALLRRDLLSYVREKRFNRVYVSEHFHSSVFFGPRYREAIVADDDARAVRVVHSPVEKDVRIGPTESEISLGSTLGREYLGDGWMWNAFDVEVASSLGETAELVVFVPRPDAKPTLTLRLSTAAVGASGTQPVSVSLNGLEVTTLQVTRLPGHHDIPLRDAVRGRNRVLLRFGAPRPRRNPGGDWWRTLDGSPVRAVHAHALWLQSGSATVMTLDVGAPEQVECRGCYGVERDGPRRFRWTNGQAKLEVKPSGLPADGECWLRVGVRFRRDFTVLLGDRPLPGSGGVYQLPPPAERPTGPIGLVSPVWSPSDDGTSTDTRKLGVAVEFLKVICW